MGVFPALLTRITVRRLDSLDDRTVLVFPLVVSTTDTLPSCGPSIGSHVMSASWRFAKSVPVVSSTWLGWPFCTDAGMRWNWVPAAKMPLNSSAPACGAAALRESGTLMTPTSPSICLPESPEVTLIFGRAGFCGLSDFQSACHSAFKVTGPLAWCRHPAMFAVGLNASGSSDPVS